MRRRFHDLAPRFLTSSWLLANAEASDGRAAARIFDGDLRRILYEILGEVPLEFGGFTFDGQALGVHFTGTTAMDPGRATRLARTAWSALVPE